MFFGKFYNMFASFHHTIQKKILTRFQVDRFKIAIIKSIPWKYLTFQICVDEVD
jgi:hypothetical protein